MNGPLSCDVHGKPRTICPVHGCGDCCLDDQATEILNAGASVVYAKEPEPND